MNGPVPDPRPWGLLVATASPPLMDGKPQLGKRTREAVLMQQALGPPCPGPESVPPPECLL